MAVAPLRSRASDAQAAWFARRVARTPDERLARIMRGPQRGFWLAQVFRAMPRQLDAERAAGVEATIEYRIGGRRGGGHDHWQATVSQGRCRTSRAAREPASVALTMDAVSFLKLVTGNATGPRLFLTGRLEIAGNLALAMRLPSLFRVPDAD